MKRQVYLTLLGGGLVCGLLAGVAMQSRLVVCLSESLEGIRGALIVKGSQLRHGDIAFIKGHPNPVVTGTITKRVMGLPGDEIHREGKTLYVSRTCVGELKEKTSRGLALTPLEENVIPEGYIFAAGDAERSFDSRYREFGLVPIDEVWGKAVLTW